MSNATSATTADSARNYPPLECPICEKPCNPKRLNGDGSVVYECKHDEKWQEGRPFYQVHHSTHKWKILADGEMVE